MIGYVMVGTKDLDASGRFYDQLFGEFGYVRTWSTERFNFWGPEGAMGAFGATLPADGNSATAGNGTMVALTASSRAQVDAVHKKALELGGTCEGEPGPRGPAEMKLYVAYFRDLDGNKLNAIYMGD